MPNQRSATNRRRTICVEDELWEAAEEACEMLGTTRTAVAQAAFEAAVATAAAMSARR